MREILFKARKIETGYTTEWVEGYYFYRIDGKHYITTISGAVFEINPSTLCQFTGLYYKDKVRVWEGDKTEHGIIVYFDGGFCLDTGSDSQMPTGVKLDRVRHIISLGSIHNKEVK